MECFCCICNFLLSFDILQTLRFFFLLFLPFSVTAMLFMYNYCLTVKTSVYIHTRGVKYVKFASFFIEIHFYSILGMSQLVSTPPTLQSSYKPVGSVQCHAVTYPNVAVTQRNLISSLFVCVCLCVCLCIQMTERCISVCSCLSCKNYLIFYFLCAFCIFVCVCRSLAIAYRYVCVLLVDFVYGAGGC